MTAKRELMYDLRDANMTIADAEEPLRQSRDPRDRADKVDMNLHQRKVYKVVKEIYYKDQLADEYLLIDTKLEPAHLTKLRKENPKRFSVLKKRKAEVEIWKRTSGPKKPIQWANVPPNLQSYVINEILGNETVPGYIQSVYAKAFSIDSIHLYKKTKRSLKVADYLTYLNSEADGKLASLVHEGDNFDDCVPVIECETDEVDEAEDLSAEPKFTYEYMVINGLLAPPSDPAQLARIKL